jgi:hypothetical protein
VIAHVFLKFNEAKRRKEFPQAASPSRHFEDCGEGGKVTLHDPN